MSCLAAGVFGQTLGSIEGTVRDASGAPLADAAVSVRNRATDGERMTHTDARGRYAVLSLPAGVYAARAAKAQFRASVRQDIRLDESARLSLDFTLQVGEMRQEITVSEATSPLGMAAENTAGLVNQGQIQQLPLNGRSYDNLLTLDPGVINYTSEKSNTTPGVSNSAVANAFSIDGRRPQENLFLIDGVEYTGSAEINMTPGGASGQLLGVDAVREFNVAAGAYSAEYGKRPGAQVSAVTQSGSNDWHGSVFDFVRTGAFDARNFFDRASVPNFGRNQFGGSLGGPVIKNKTFFFANYEGFRQHLNLSDVTLVPDNNARQGFLPTGAGGALADVGLAPGVADLLRYWPAQNGPELFTASGLPSGIAEAFSTPRQNIREDFGVARLDHAISARDSLNASYIVDDSGAHTPTANPLSLDIESLREQVVSLHETHVFSPAVVNDATAGFSRASYFYTGEPGISGAGFVEGKPMGALVIGGSASPNTPSAITPAGSNIGSNLFAARNLFTYADTVSGSRGAHQWSVGVWLQRVQSNDQLALGQYGQATFANLTQFLAGNIATFTTIPSPTPLGWRSLEGAWFVQDRIRVAPRLTLSLGLRHEFTSGWNESHNRAANFVYAPDGTLETQPHVGGSVFASNHAKLLFQPRAGLAWDVFGNYKTIVRVGAGMYADLQDALSYRLDQNAPFNTGLTLHNASVSSLHITPGAPPPSGAAISPAGVDPNLDTPMIATYNLRIEQRIAPGTVLSIGYIGSHGVHEIISADLNEPVPTSSANGTYYYAPGSPLANPQLGPTWTWISQGTSSYNALQIDLNRRLSRGLSLRAAYTWSKSLDDGDTLNASAAANAPGLVEETSDIRGDRGLSTFDARNAGSIAFNYDLPLGGRFFGGWSLDGIFTARSGFPFTPELSFNPSNNGNAQNPVRPSWNPAFHGPVIVGSPNEWFNPNAFIVGPAGSYGNVGRDTLTGPSLSELDLSLRKTIPLGERWRAELRVEAFNLLNRANFSTPNIVVFTSATAPPSGTAGLITSTATSSRQMQFALKLIW
ncbi:MAG: carboxypeptidase regulatory-like domain-containing protein [Bryobacteraceae bacterium]